MLVSVLYSSYSTIIKRRSFILFPFDGTQHGWKVMRFTLIAHHDVGKKQRYTTYEEPVSYIHYVLDCTED